MARRDRPTPERARSLRQQASAAQRAGETERAQTLRREAAGLITGGPPPPPQQVDTIGVGETVAGVATAPEAAPEPVTAEEIPPVQIDPGRTQLPFPEQQPAERFPGAVEGDVSDRVRALRQQAAGAAAAGNPERARQLRQQASRLRRGLAPEPTRAAAVVTEEPFMREVNGALRETAEIPEVGVVPPPELGAAPSATDFETDLQFQAASLNQSLENEFNSTMQILEQFSQNITADLAGDVNEIGAIFDRRRREQERINQDELAIQTQAGIRAGRQRFAPEVQAGIMSATESAGLQRIADLDSQEQSALNAARSAARDKQMGVMLQQVGLARQLRLDKTAAIKDLKNEARQQEEDQRRREAFRQDQILFQQRQEDLQRSRAFENAEFFLKQVETAGPSFLGRFSDEDLAVIEEQTGFSPGYLRSVQELQLAQPQELADIDASASKLLGKMIRKDGTFVTDERGDFLTFELSEQDKTKYQSQFNPITGDQVIFNPTTGQVIQRIDAAGRITAGVPSGGVFSQTGDFIPRHQLPSGGMRTDRHNNPTALMFEGFDQMLSSIGYREGIDFARGDAFPENPNLHTIAFDSSEKGIQAAVDIIDNFSFFTQSGAPRWVHTAMPQEQWNLMDTQQKRDVIKEMYKREGGSGEIFDEASDFTVGPVTTEEDVRSLAVRQGKNPKEVAGAVANWVRTGELPRGKQLAPTQITTLSDGENAIRVMQDIKEIVDGAETEGLIGGFLGRIGPLRGLTADIPILGSFDIPIQTKQATLKRAMQLVGKFMEGGVLRREDEVKYEKMLPNVKDTPTVARSKWAGVMSMLIARYKTELGTMTNTGFDTIDVARNFTANLLPLAPQAHESLRPEDQEISFTNFEELEDSGQFTPEELKEIRNAQ